MNRKPVIAGQFYEADFNFLNKQIKEYFKVKLGPGDLPVTERTKNIFGVIAPHAGYQFSGPCAGWSYKEVTESRFPDLFLVIGVNHTGLGALLASYLYRYDWQLWGWIIIVIAVLTQIPCVYKVLKK